jgi:hypothetical protein
MPPPPPQTITLTPPIIPADVPYTIHHIQYRSISKIKPILNSPVSSLYPSLYTDTDNNGNTSSNSTINTINNNNNNNNTIQHQSSNKKHLKHNITPPAISHISLNRNKPQYRKKTVFEVMADYQYDVYNLYAFNNRSTPFLPHPPSISPSVPQKHIFVDIAYVPDYGTSKTLNKIFRNIKENDNLDYIEESDDEDEFENTKPDRFVDLSKRVNMECYFHQRFKRWVPVRVVDKMFNCGKIVPITNL